MDEIGSDHRVVRLNVAMRNPATLKEASGSGQLSDDWTDLSGWQFVEHLSQSTRLQQLHHHKEVTRGGALPAIYDINEIWMTVPCKLLLAKDARQLPSDSRTFDHFRINDFQRRFLPVLFRFQDDC